jgi:hypothetical protein
MASSNFENFIAQAVKDLRHDKPPFTSYVESCEYFILKNNEGSEKFQVKWKYYLKDDNAKDWKHLVRKIKNSNSLGVKEMFGTVILISNRYLVRDEYFKIEHENGTFTLPNKIDKLNKILELIKEFLYKIFPSIDDNLNFRSSSHNEHRNIIRGKIDWNRTLMQPINLSHRTPMVFTCLLNETNFETEENILSLSSLMCLQNDIEYLLKTNYDDEIDVTETDKLKKYDQIIMGLLNQTNLKPIIPKAREFADTTMESRKFINLIEKTKERNYRGLVTEKAYEDLIIWVNKYRDLNIQSVGKLLTDFPWQEQESVDTMFELWILFEMVSYFEDKKNVRIVKQEKNGKGNFAGFRMNFNGINFALLYEEQITKNTFEQTSKPDFIIKIGNRYPVVMDPKNWTGNFGDARHKVLGYMKNLESYDTKTGIVFFSNKPGIIEEGKTSHVAQVDDSTLITFHQNVKNVSKEARHGHFDMIFDRIVDEMKQSRKSTST